MQKEQWNQRYNTGDFIYGRQPSEFFKTFLSSRPAGRICLPCEGEGRNAVFAALSGWKVTAFDQSEVGREKALQFASEAGVKIDYELSDALEFDYGKEEYDVIAFIWAHFPAQIRRLVHNKAEEGLVKGGILLLEGFSKKQLAFTSGGPKEPEMLFSLDYWPEDFPGLTTIQLEDARIFLHESEFHKGEAEVIHYLGLKS